jgi:microcystin degradation protein MlrC
MYRVGIAGFIHESNTFSPMVVTREHFVQGSLTNGKALIERWRGSHHELGGFLDGAQACGIIPVPLIATYAMPGGVIESGTFNQLVDEIIQSVHEASPLDGLLVALHGAAVAENHPDADGEIARRLRQTVGPEIPIVMTLDLHANVSPTITTCTNAAICYRSNPHLDQEYRGFEAAGLMARSLRGEARPVQALEKPPVIFNISKQNTEVAPALTLYQDLQSVLQWPGILSASAAMGFYYADVEDMGASFIAVADGDMSLAIRAAQWMASRAWERRHEFVGVLPTPDQAVRRAAEICTGPVVLMDVGDNVGGGSPGDSTILFDEIMRQNVANALVILFDPQAVVDCIAAGVRNQIEITVGAKTDKLHGRPIKVKGRVRLISDGIFIETQVRHGGWGMNDQGATSIVETDQGHTVVLTSQRMAPMSLEQLLSLGIKPERKKVIVVKGVIAPLAAYRSIAAEIITVDTPGSTSANPTVFEYRRRRRPLYPLESDAEYSPRILG